jgi:hypothetical protein
MAYARGSVDTVNFRRLEAMRPGHGFVRDFAVHHVDVADERRLFLAGRRARIHELRPGLLVLGVGMTRARGQQRDAIFLFFDFFGKADDHRLPPRYQSGRPSQLRPACSGSVASTCRFKIAFVAAGALASRAEAVYENKM